jgi:hypothetical protein
MHVTYSVQARILKSWRGNLPRLSAISSSCHVFPPPLSGFNWCSLSSLGGPGPSTSNMAPFPQGSRTLPYRGLEQKPLGELVYANIAQETVWWAISHKYIINAQEILEWANCKHHGTGNTLVSKWASFRNICTWNTEFSLLTQISHRKQ